MWNMVCQELREIAYMDSVKGKHFFMESDMRGQNLKMDNTGKALLTVSILEDVESTSRCGLVQVIDAPPSLPRMSNCNTPW